MFRFLGFWVLIFFATQLSAQGSQRLSATDFATQLKAVTAPVIIDVRTPGEFQGGHLANAQNYPINTTEFKKKVAGLDKNQPVFVYCLSGGRSNAAAQQMAAAGFTKVFDMAGGIIQWRALGLPEEGGTASKKGMTMAEYTALTHKKSLVLIDFYAEWCAPCKKMKPFLEEIDQDMANTVDVVRIDADVEKELCQNMNVDALPVLILYKDGKEVWNHKAFISKSELIAKINYFSNK